MFYATRLRNVPLTIWCQLHILKHQPGRPNMEDTLVERVVRAGVEARCCRFIGVWKGGILREKRPKLLTGFPRAGLSFLHF